MGGTRPVAHSPGPLEGGSGGCRLDDAAHAAAGGVVLIPACSFNEAPGMLDGIPVPAMSVAGMLAMKEQFPALRNGRPWRDKDVSDIAVLRGLLRSGSC